MVGGILVGGILSGDFIREPFRCSQSNEHMNARSSLNDKCMGVALRYSMRACGAWKMIGRGCCGFYILNEGRVKNRLLHSWMAMYA